MTYTGPERRKQRLEDLGYSHIVVVMLQVSEIQEFCSFLADQIVYGRFIVIPSTHFLHGVRITYPHSSQAPYTIIRTVVGFEDGRDAMMLKLAWG